MQRQLLKVRQGQRSRPVFVFFPDCDDGDFPAASGHVTNAIVVAVAVRNDRPLASLAIKKVAEMMSHIAMLQRASSRYLNCWASALDISGASKTRLSNDDVRGSINGQLPGG